MSDEQDEKDYVKEQERLFNKARKQGAVEALNSVEFRQLLLQAKVTELEKIMETMFGHPKPYASYEHCWNVLKQRIEKRLLELKKVGCETK